MVCGHCRVRLWRGAAALKKRPKPKPPTPIASSSGSRWLHKPPALKKRPKPKPPTPIPKTRSKPIIQAELGVANARELQYEDEDWRLALHRRRLLEQENERLRRRMQENTIRYHRQEEQLLLRDVVIRQLRAALASMTPAEPAPPPKLEGGREG